MQLIINYQTNLTKESVSFTSDKKANAFLKKILSTHKELKEAEGVHYSHLAYKKEAKPGAFLKVEIKNIKE